MEISKATRTHLVYQFIIVTLLFLGIGYNELLPDRKFIAFLAFLPIFSYQLIVLSCCMDLMPVPTWLGFLQISSANTSTKEENSFEKDFPVSSSPVSSSKVSRTHSEDIKFPEIAEILPYPRRWEKSVTNLGESPKLYVCQKKSKSWVNLSDSRSSERLSSQGSLDTLTSVAERIPPKLQIRGDKVNREERATKARSWKTGVKDFNISGKLDLTKTTSFPQRNSIDLPSENKGDHENQDESSLEKSYSFPFRQRRLQTWLEMKEAPESPARQTNQIPDIPYWQTVGYNLAVKYEARRRQRAMENSTKVDVPDEKSASHHNSEENVREASADRPSRKRSSKSTSACMSKIKVGFTNLISKMKEEGNEISSSSSYKVNKPMMFKLKNKSTPSQVAKEKEPAGLPPLPQFLNNDRPLIFYPKHIPFEKERFENDVNKKMVELSEQKFNKFT